VEYKSKSAYEITNYKLKEHRLMIHFKTYFKISGKVFRFLCYQAVYLRFVIKEEVLFCQFYFEPIYLSYEGHFVLEFIAVRRLY